MLRIEVSGEGNTKVAKIIEDALKEAGIKALRFTEAPEAATVPVSYPVEAVILPAVHARPGGELDYLVGRSEAVAYELAQDAGYRVRITLRDGHYLVGTRDHDVKRVNFEVRQNIVVSYGLG